MAQDIFTVDSGTTSVFLDLPLLESAAGITLVDADSTGETFSEEFQVGFPIEEDTDFTFELPSFTPDSGSIEHSGNITLGVSGTEVTVGEFSIGFDAARVSDTASGFFVADTTDDALGLEVLFDVGADGSLDADSDSLTISDRDLLLAPEFTEVLDASDLTGADVGDVRIDAATSSDTATSSDIAISTSSDTDTSTSSDIAISTSSDTDTSTSSDTDTSTSSDTAISTSDDTDTSPIAAEVINLLSEEGSTIDVSADTNSDFVNVGGFYTAIDTEGTVIDPVSGAEISVGDDGYEEAALANSIGEIGDSEATTLDLEGDFVYVPYLLADGEQFFSSFAGANPEGIDHVQSPSENIFSFEDLVGGGDLDFNDFVLTVEVV